LKGLTEVLLEQVPAQMRHWISTINFFEQVVLFVQCGISIRSMPQLLKKQKGIGCPMGIHYMNRKGVKNVLMDVGITYHELTLSGLLANNQPVSIILDGSTMKGKVTMCRCISIPGCC